MMYNRQRKAVLEQNDTKHVRSLQATSSQKEETQKKKGPEVIDMSSSEEEISSCEEADFDDENSSSEKTFQNRAANLIKILNLSTRPI
jgi:hypothetical protein